jgi:hypothetical protein
VLHRLTGDHQAAASHQQALQSLREIGEPGTQGYAHNDLGLVQQETGDYQAAASHQQALRLMRDVGEPYGQAYVLNSLGELASRTSATGQARDHHSQAGLRPRDRRTAGRKHAPWKEPATAISRTATTTRARRSCARLWPSTSASGSPPPAAATTSSPAKAGLPARDYNAGD